MTVDDELLNDSPLGRFTLAIAEAAEALSLDGIDAIRVVHHPAIPDTGRCELQIQPMGELPVAEPELGRDNVRLRVRLIELEQDDPEKCRSVGWRLRTRDRLRRRFNGFTYQQGELIRGEDCFSLLRCDFGPLYDDAARQMGLHRSDLIVTADYKG